MKFSNQCSVEQKAKLTPLTLEYREPGELLELTYWLGALVMKQLGALVGQCTGVWIKVAQVYFSESRSGLNMRSPPSFPCHTY